MEIRHDRIVSALVAQGETQTLKLSTVLPVTTECRPTSLSRRSRELVIVVVSIDCRWIVRVYNYVRHDQQRISTNISAILACNASRRLQKHRQQPL